MSATATSTDALVDRLFEATIGTLELYSVHLGWRLGLYEMLAAHGPLTPAQLAERADIDERYAREWLEQQAVAALLDFDGGRFSLPEAHAAVLADPDSPAFVAAFAPMVVGIGGALPDVVRAYRTGDGVPYQRFGADFREGQAAINRPSFLHDLGGWLASVPEIDGRLRAAPAARVADVGCGLGASTLAIARAYPDVLVEGIDDDAASVEAAREAAQAGGLSDRVTFTIRDAATGAGGPYDVVCIFEALHDMARPVEALAAARASLAAGGCVLVADERVADRFEAPGDPVERMMYGWSVSHCLPSSRCDHPSAALGTALRSDTVLELGAQAGFARTEVLDIEHDFFRFYRLVP